MEKRDKMDFKKLRESLGLSQNQMAKKIGVHLNTWRLWEYGKFKPSKMAREKLEKILKEGEK